MFDAENELASSRHGAQLTALAGGARVAVVAEAGARLPVAHTLGGALRVEVAFVGVGRPATAVDGRWVQVVVGDRLVRRGAGHSWPVLVLLVLRPLHGAVRDRRAGAHAEHTIVVQVAPRDVDKGQARRAQPRTAIGAGKADVAVARVLAATLAISRAAVRCDGAKASRVSGGRTLNAERWGSIWLTHGIRRWPAPQAKLREQQRRSRAAWWPAEG